MPLPLDMTFFLESMVRKRKITLDVMLNSIHFDSFWVMSKVMMEFYKGYLTLKPKSPKVSVPLNFEHARK